MSAAYLRSANRYSRVPWYSANNVGFRIAYGYTNKAPTDLNSTAPLTVAENQPVGAIVGEFNATDPDGHAIEFSYFAQLGNNIEPVLWYDASDESSVIASSGAVSKWIDLSENGYDLIQNTQSQKPSYGESKINFLNTVRFDQPNIQHLKSENALNGSLFPDGTGQWLAVVSFVGDDPGYSIFETSTGAGWHRYQSQPLP